MILEHPEGALTSSTEENAPSQQTAVNIEMNLSPSDEKDLNKGKTRRKHKTIAIGKRFRFKLVKKNEQFNSDERN